MKKLLSMLFALVMCASVVNPVAATYRAAEDEETNWVQENGTWYILDENELPKLVYIKVSGQDGDYSLISEGLDIGQTVLTSGIQKVIPGTPVRIVEQEVIDTPETTKISFIQKIKNKINQILKRGKN